MHTTLSVHVQCREPLDNVRLHNGIAQDPKHSERYNVRSNHDIYAHWRMVAVIARCRLVEDGCTRDTR